jgi:hypothetical protein
MKTLLKNTGFLLLLTALLALPGLVLAKGPPIKVERAIPGEVIQGQQNYQVKIKGSGFAQGATVRFLVAGTEDGDQIKVTSVVYDDATGDLDTIINVNDLATVSYYDIEVSLAGRRGGKGTDLFKVQSKSGGNDNLVAEFCLDMNDLTPGFGSDGNEYCHSKKEHVIVRTGAGPGFRFDSNSTKKAPKRTVSVSFPGILGEVDIYDDNNNFLTTFLSMGYEIDLRFNQKNGGLDLGSLNPGNHGFVPVDVSLESADGMDSIGISYSVDTVPFSHGHLAEQTCTGKNTLEARVERISSTSWVVESNPLNSNACLWDMNSDLLLQQKGTVVNLPFRLKITTK